MTTNEEIDLQRERERWEETTLNPHLSQHGERDVSFETSSGSVVERLYTPGDPTEEARRYYDKIGFPGQYPYTRGPHPTMYRGRLWTMRQYAGYGAGEDTNERFKFLLSQGQTGLSMAFDLPTQIGYDADDPLAEDEVGKVGVSICSLKDMEDVLEGIPLDEITMSMTINTTAAVMLAMYVAIAKRQGANLAKIGGTIQHDILKEYIVRGTYAFPPRPSLRIVADVFSWCTNHLPAWNTISFSGYHMREAGCTAAQEVGFTMANGIANIEVGLKAGLGIDEFAPRISLFWAIHNIFLEEVAKLRAARRMWSRIMKERFGAQDPRSVMPRFHVQTGGATLTAQQPDNNVVRGAYQALAAVLGGTQSMSISCKDEALALPTEEAQRMALRTQQLIAHEIGVTDTIDPLAGSYYIEHLTDEIESEAEDYIDRIDKMGGAIAALESGFQQKEIQEAAVRMQQEIETKRRIVVGVNDYVEDEVPAEGLMKVSPEVGKRQRARLEELKSDRDNNRVDQLLSLLKETAQGTENLMPVLISCVEGDVTLGEICGTLRKVWGEYQAVRPL